jgi:hypothetical protein
VLAWAPSLHYLAHNTVKGSNTHTALFVSGECVVAGEAVPAFAWIRFDARVDFGMALEVMLTHKALVTIRALVLPVVEMGLDVGFDVLFTPESFITVLEDTDPLVVMWLRALDILVNIIESDAGYRSCLLDVQRCNACCACYACDRLGSAVW